MQQIKKVNDLLYNIIKAVSIVMFVVMVVLCIVQVIYRYILQLPLSFSEELARYLFIWITFLGTAMALKKNKLVKMELLIQTFPVGVQKAIQITMFVLAIVTYGILLYSGIVVVDKTMAQTSAALAVPMGLIYASVPVSAIFMVLFECGAFLETMMKGREDETT